MTDAAERFIAAASRPLEDNRELHLAARQQLSESIAAADARGSDSLETATERLEKIDVRGHGRVWRVVLYGIVGAAFLAMMVSEKTTLRYAADAIPVIQMTGGGAASVTESLPDFADDLTPREKLILFGDTTHHSPSRQARGLWDSEPENPVYFANYVARFLQEHRTLPPDTLEIANRIDPSNGWFHALAASLAAEQALDTTFSARITTPGGVKIAPVRDETKLREAIMLFHEAASRSRFECYESQLLRERIALLPKRTDSLDQMPRLAYLTMTMTATFKIQRLSQAIAAEAIRLAEAGDVEGFERHLVAWKSWSETWLSAPAGNLIEILVAMSAVISPSKAMREAAENLGLAEEAERLGELVDRVEERQKTRARHKTEERHEDLRLKAGALSSLTLPAVARTAVHPPVLRDQDVMPGRLADHSLFGRLTTLLSSGLLALIFIATCLFRFRGGPLARRLSLPMTNLLRARDWCWIIGGGVVLPWLWFLAFTRLTPLGTRDWSLRASNFAAPAFQYGALLVLTVLLPVTLARWRIRLRAGSVGLSARRQWGVWLGPVAVAVLVPIAGAGLTFGLDFPAGLGITIPFAAVALLYLGWISMRARWSADRATCCADKRSRARSCRPMPSVSSRCLPTARSSTPRSGTGSPAIASPRSRPKRPRPAATSIR